MIWSRYTGQQIPCFDRCQLIMAWMSKIKEVHSKPWLHISVILFFLSMAAMLGNFAVFVVVHTRPQAIPVSHDNHGEAQWPNGQCARSRSEWPGFEAWPGTLCCVLAQDTQLSQCLSPPRSINGYRRIVGET